MPLVYRLAIVVVVAELLVDLLGVMGLFVPNPATKYSVLFAVLVLTAISDAAELITLHFVPVGGGGAYSMSRNAMKVSVTAATLALVLAIVALGVLVFPLGLGIVLTNVLVGVAILGSLVLDGATAVQIYRR